MPQALLLAMSGVRIVDRELATLGLTLPGFIERGKVIASMPSLGLLTIAGALPRHWEVRYREVDTLDEATLPALLDERPDLVMVGALSARVEDAYRLLDGFRERGVPTVLGGLHASVLPDEAGEHADTVVAGQGEWVVPTLATDFEQGRLLPFYSGMGDRRSLDSAPSPRYDLLDPERYNRIPLQTTRGCPLDCSFCAASRLISPYKRKSIDRVREELESILALWPDAFIELADDNTFVDKRWSRDLARLFAEYPRVRWFTETDISLADDPALLGLLAASGCAQVLVGLESVSEASLKDADSKDWKRRRRRDYYDRIAGIQDAGISVNGCFVFGFDADQPETFDLTWEFIRESDLSEVQITLLTPFPGTGLYRKMKETGRLLQERFWEKCTLFDVTFRPKNFSVESLEEAFRAMVATVYSEEASSRRTLLRRALYRKRAANATEE